MGLASPMHPIRPQPSFALHPSDKPKEHSEQPRTKQLLLPSCQRRAPELHFALVVPTKAGTRPAVHGCRPHFRRALAGALAIDHCPDPEIGGWHSVSRARKTPREPGSVFRALHDQNSFHASGMPIPSQNSRACTHGLAKVESTRLRLQPGTASLRHARPVWSWLGER